MDQSPLTEADLMSHKVISSQLSSISQIPIISEESENIYTKSKIYWLIDPLDGTKEFINKNGEFTVNIALIENHFPLIGIVYHPVSGIAYIGGKSLGAIKIEETNEHKNIFVSGTDSLIRVVASRSHLNESTKNFIKELGSVTTIHSGSSLKFCLVAEGLADIYPRLAPTSEWDTAAAQAVVEGAGGSVLTLDGSRVRYQKENISNPDFIVRGANKLSV
tara:strand:- start:47 stop:703 length:657 start_codon:yes stop_codon:yes gene_type:complete